MEVSLKDFQYTVNSSKSFDAAVSAVEQKTAEKGFRVLHTHDFAGTLTEKEFVRKPLKLVEICNARYADKVLNKDVSVALMLPCPIAVYIKDGKTFISTMRPSALADSIRTQEFKALRLRSRKWFWKSSTKQNSWIRAGAHVRRANRKRSCATGLWFCLRHT